VFPAPHGLPGERNLRGGWPVRSTNQVFIRGECFEYHSQSHKGSPGSTRRLPYVRAVFYRTAPFPKPKATTPAWARSLRASEFTLTASSIRRFSCWVRSGISAPPWLHRHAHCYFAYPQPRAPLTPQRGRDRPSGARPPPSTRLHSTANSRTSPAALSRLASRSEHLKRNPCPSSNPRMTLHPSRTRTQGCQTEHTAKIVPMATSSKTAKLARPSSPPCCTAVNAGPHRGGAPQSPEPFTCAPVDTPRSPCLPGTRARPWS